MLFTTEEEGDDKLDQIEVDGETYIVKAGVGAEGAAGWNALPPVGGEHGDVYFNNVYWTGAGDPQANSRLRIDTKQPTRRH